MQNLVIVGAGGFGREIFTLVKECIAAGLQLRIKGFLDKSISALDNYDNYPPILGDVDDYSIEENDVFIIAITSCQIKKNLHSVLKNRGAKFISIVHPSSFLTQGVNMGEGCIISRECILSNDSKIGSFVTFNARAVIGHDTVINDYAHIDTSVFIGGNCIIGTEATLYTKAIILQGLEVSEKVIVGAGSVVVKNITKPCTVFGSPARIIM